MKERPSRGKPEILVVEDDAELLELLGEALQTFYTVHSAQSIDEAKRILAHVRPGLLVLDIQLQEENGFQLLRAFRQKSMAPVLLMTGHGSEAVAAQAIELRANAYLQKPIAVKVLREKIAALLAEGPRPEHLAERAKELIDQAASSAAPTIDVAEQLGVNPRYLRAAFQGRFGRSPLEYQREMRLRRAQELLLTTDLPVSEIAVQAGFRDSTYFGRVFKRHLGITPVAFRHSYLPKGPDTEDLPS